MADTDNQAPEDFAATLERLEALVTRLESGELSLEASLAAFEQGVRLSRDAQRRLDEAELKVRALVEQPDGSLEEAAFDNPANTFGDQE
ncbi:Exodeoxyribonuclease VII small subunit [Modicisalibacter ilicicola DSM 19980]|uniref:Exodeoxyribonuclease 7 small subunit n=1 Tax=Modicisalibacter ilicicola DSM 19980 TaxID=1121942 RepID=A0A1M5AC53_9GAMM|nr:exodeoxyribonuclease VII small subunit [Halomonas ilicicola]SHF27765.1 Exodeoxyribonuclease VII small subunit [Halomonas ilicicola DSM 19980]